ncbi:MAG: hypothetical protein M1536_09315 [Firmicutes bacterium]|nr:hypothetical protein [Bacillota bacterium]
MTEDEKKALADMMEKKARERQTYWKQAFDNNEMKDLQSGVVRFKKYTVVILIIIIGVFSALVLYNAGNLSQEKKASITGMLVEQSAPAAPAAPKIETNVSTQATLTPHKDVDIYENKLGEPSPIPELKEKFTTNGDPILIQ